MSRKRTSVPVPRLHKPSGRARLYVNGEYIYLGEWGSPEADLEYRRVMAEILAGTVRPAEVRVNDLVARFLEHGKEFYRKPSGRPTGTLEDYIKASRPLVALFGETLVGNFGPPRFESRAERHGTIRPREKHGQQASHLHQNNVSVGGRK